MARSDATTVDEYLSELPDDRRAAIVAVRDVILANLPDGYEEVMRWGMITYEIPLARYPDTYNGEPLQYAALASQQRHMSVYLNGIYSDPGEESWFADAYRATGKKLDMGKSCVRFKRLDDLPLDLVGQAIARTGVDDYLAAYEASRGTEP